MFEALVNKTKYNGAAEWSNNGLNINLALGGVIMFDDLRVAAYLNEAGDSLPESVATFADCGLHYTVLGNMWLGNIADVNDGVCANIRSALNSVNVSTIALNTNVGNVPVMDLAKIAKPDVERVFNRCRFFNSQFVKFGSGFSTSLLGSAGDYAVEYWWDLLSALASDYDVVPLIEITNSGYSSDCVTLIKLLEKYKSIKLLYNPSALILDRNVDPFLKYWVLLSKFVALVNLRDFKVGVGFKPVGFGDAKLKAVVSDSLNSGGSHWFCLQPNLGSRFGSLSGRSSVFKSSVKALDSIFK